MKILISRTDNIGDLVLTLPLAGLLKAKYPDCEVWFLARAYAAFVAESAEYVDGVLTLEGLGDDAQAMASLRQQNFAVLIHAFPNKRVARLGAKAGIQRRIGTSHRFYHWLYCNARVNFSRRRSMAHEALLNCELLRPLRIRVPDSVAALVPYIKLNAVDTSLPVSIDPNRFTLILHPGSNGNGREWPSAYFQQLVEHLPAEDYQIFVTGSEAEGVRFQQVFSDSSKLTTLFGRLSLIGLLGLIQHADGLIAAGTGPLHLAACAGIHTLGLYPNRVAVGPQRWAPLGSKAEYLAKSTPCIQDCRCGDCPCMLEMTPGQVLSHIQAWQKQGVEREPLSIPIAPVSDDI